MKYQYSYSRIEQFLSCPFAFYCATIKKMKEIPSQALLIGRTVHDIIAAYNRHCLSERKATDLSFLKTLLEQKQNEIPGDLFDEIQKVIFLFRDSHFLNFEVITDARFELELAFDENWKQVDWYADDVFFRGKLDQIHIENPMDPLVVITDFKSDRHIEPASSIQKSFQLKIYAWLAHLLYPDAIRFLIRLDFVRYPGAVPSKVIELDEIEEVPGKIMSYVEKIEKTTKFESRISSYCFRGFGENLCGFTKYCEAYNKAIEQGTIDRPALCMAEAKKLAEIVRMQQLALKSNLNRLKRWIDQNQGIIVGDEELNFHPVIERSFTTSEEVARILLQEGIDKTEVWELVNFPVWKVESFLKKKQRRELMESLKNLVAENISTRFEFKKIKRDKND